MTQMSPNSDSSVGVIWAPLNNTDENIIIERVVTFDVRESLSQNYISFLKVHLVIRNRILSNSNLLTIHLKEKVAEC